MSVRVLRQGYLSVMRFLWTMATKQLSVTHNNNTIFCKIFKTVNSHWLIGVFRWEYASTVVTSRFLCFPGTIWNHFKAGSLTLKYKILRNSNDTEMKKPFPSFDLGIDHLFPSDSWKESKRKNNNSDLHASMLVSYTTSSRELKRRQQNTQ